ncbi:hypothetical protein GCM10010519_14970 [Streptomyces lactacystinicus]
MIRTLTGGKGCDRCGRLSRLPRFAGALTDAVTPVSAVSGSDRLTDPPVTVPGQNDGLTGDSGQCTVPGHLGDRRKVRRRR